jgi:hypothetical protein
VGNPELPKDVIQYPTRGFNIPFFVRPLEKDQDKIEKVPLFVSADRGKTWKRVMDGKPNDERFGSFEFTADRDFQQYWFATQAHFKSGKIEPAETGKLQPAMKIYVNPLRNDAKVQRVPEK